MKEITDKLYELRDEEYGRFTARLMPTVDPASVLGVRTPDLRQIAKWVYKNGLYDEFFAELPHRFFEENNLHAFVIENIKDYDECLRQVNAFLPYVDNWATCDQMSPKVFKKHPELIDSIREWTASDNTYTVRFGIGMLMRFFLDEGFKPEYLDLVADIKSDEYYINMMIAWFFATALCKQYDAALPYITANRLDKWTHNKTIQKAIESYRITDVQKQELRALKIK